MTHFTALPLRIVFCRAPQSGGSAKAPPDWGAATASELELALFGDPAKDRSRRWEPLDLAAAIPLKDDIEVRTFTTRPQRSDGSLQPAPELFDEVLHTILLVFVDDLLLGNSDLVDWLADGLRHCDASSGRHLFVAVVPGEETRNRWLAKPGLGTHNVVDFSKLGEEAERLDWLSLQVLDWAMKAAASGAGEDSRWKVRFFVSHAKRDGISLAQSLRDRVKEIRWLESFYDAWSLDPSRPWIAQLEEAVASSVVVALRTDNYDHRPWCQAEVLWAEQHGSPLVLVDARSGLVHAASNLPYESAPCVRIPDGNLVRILHAALRVALRARIFLRRARELEGLGLLKGTFELIPVTPGLSAIAGACSKLERAARDVGKPPPYSICHPDPGLRDVISRAAQALAASASVPIQIVTPRTLLSAPGVTL